MYAWICCGRCGRAGHRTEEGCFRPGAVPVLPPGRPQIMIWGEQDSRYAAVVGPSTISAAQKTQAIALGWWLFPAWRTSRLPSRTLGLACHQRSHYFAAATGLTSGIVGATTTREGRGLSPGYFRWGRGMPTTLRPCASALKTRIPIVSGKGSLLYRSSGKCIYLAIGVLPRGNTSLCMIDAAQIEALSQMH
jgi:hypothetical protein